MEANKPLIYNLWTLGIEVEIYNIFFVTKRVCVITCISLNTDTIKITTQLNIILFIGNNMLNS